MKKNYFFTVLLCLLLAPELATTMNKNNLEKPLLQDENNSSIPLHAIPEWENPVEPIIFGVSQEQITLFQEEITRVRVEVLAQQQNRSVSYKTYIEAIYWYKEIIPKLKTFLDEIKHENNMVIVFNQGTDDLPDQKYDVKEYRVLANTTIKQLRKEIKKWETLAHRKKIKNDIRVCIRDTPFFVLAGCMMLCLIGCFIGVMSLPFIMLLLLFIRRPSFGPS